MRCWLVLLILVCAGRAHAAPLGQWVWSRADVAPLSAARALRPDIGAAVQVAELRFQDGAPRALLRLSPSTAGGAQVAVIRFHASFHGVWSLPPAALRPAISATLQRVLALTRSAAPGLKIVQLDYDCPTQRLVQWAQLLAALQAEGRFTGWELWLTSLVAQLRDPRFGPLFRSVAAGHVVQVFDTAELADARAQAELAQLLTRAGMPFCVGLGAFERKKRGNDLPLTQHEAWWDAMPALARAPGFRGTWVFAAGQNWNERVRGLP